VKLLRNASNQALERIAARRDVQSYMIKPFQLQPGSLSAAIAQLFSLGRICDGESDVHRTTPNAFRTSDYDAPLRY